MSEFINFLQTNLKTLIVLLAGAGSVTATYLYNTRHYRDGYKTGKKVVKKFPKPITEILTSNSQKNIQERVETVKDMAFQLGRSVYIKDYNQNVIRLEEQINFLKKTLEDKKETTTSEYKAEDKKIEEEIHELEVSLQIKEKELFQLKREEDEKNEMLEQNSKVKNQRIYFFSGPIQKTRESLSKAMGNLENDLLRCFYAGIVAVLLYGDYSISYMIVNDLFKIEYRDKFQIVIFSIIFMVVFLVFAGFALEAIDKYSVKYKILVNRIKTISAITLILILALIYIFMVSLSALEAKVALLDIILRLLFVPMVLAVALTIHKIQKEYGFSFLFTPLKVVLYLILMSVFNILFLFEAAIDYIHRYLRKEKFESKSKLTLTEEVKNIGMEILRKGNTRLILKQKFEDDVHKLIIHYEVLISKIEEKLNRLNLEMAKIRKGCEDGVMATLKLVE